MPFPRNKIRYFAGFIVYRMVKMFYNKHKLKSGAIPLQKGGKPWSFYPVTCR